MQKNGKIIKLLGGFYYVVSEDGVVEETRARGILRHQNVKPLVGDNVVYDFAEGEELSYIEKVTERKNHLIRPPVANVDQVLLFVPIKSPKYNLYLVDKLIAYYESLGIDVIIIISKSDLGEDAATKLSEIYLNSGFKVYLLSEHSKEGFDKLRQELKYKTSALSGVSGAGKSTFTNRLLNKSIETQEVSRKSDRGKHTTRHTELMNGPEGIFLFDTPGFSSMDLVDISSEDLDSYFREFIPYKEYCQFQDCSHLNESSCGVRDAFSAKEIYPSRYKNYVKLYRELKEKEKEKWR